VVAQIEILRSAFKTPPASDNAVPTPSRWSEVVWTLIPAVGLAVVLVFTWRAVEAHGQAKAIQPVQSSVVVEHPS